MKIFVSIGIGFFLICLAASASAQEFILRGDAGGAIASSGPYHFGARTATLYFGRTLDSEGQHEITASVGFFSWGESPVGRESPWGINSTTLYIDNQTFVVPTDRSSNRITSFKFSDGKMTLSNGAIYNSNYAAKLDSYPFMLNYRYSNGAKLDRFRYFLGAGLGLARITTSTNIPSTYTDAAGGGMLGPLGGTCGRWSVTSHLDAGVTIRIGQRMYVDLGYTLQLFRGSTYDMYSVVYKLDDLYVHVAQASFTWRF